MSDEQSRFGSTSRRTFLSRASLAASAAGFGLTGARDAGAEPVHETVEVEMSDGVILRGDIYYPPDGEGGVEDGTFPVVLTVSPYRNGVEEEPYAWVYDLVPEGYVQVVVDVRGTGSSGGQWEMWGPREQEDYGELVHWAADLPASDGNVGMIGLSYMGINQFLAARAAGRDSPLEALFPMHSGVCPYRSVIFNGGLWNQDFNAAWFGYSTTATPGVAALTSAPGKEFDEAVDDVQDRAGGSYQSGGSNLVAGQLGTDRSYREGYWRIRTPEYALPAVVEYDIPVFAYTGWFDLLQPGAPLIYTQMQNVWAGRDQFAPMDPTQPVSGRYQTLIGPYGHIQHPDYVDLARLWFDRFLKGEDNGIDETDTPLHLFQAYGDRWFDAATWPLPEVSARTYYLREGATGTAPGSLNDGRLAPEEPSAAEASDSIPWNAAGNPCTPWTEFNNATLVYNNLDGNADDVPCSEDNAVHEVPALSYTTPPFDEGTDLAGPGSVTLYATANTPNTSWVVTLKDVGPDGSLRPLAHGQLQGSFRDRAPERSWRVTGDGRRFAGEETDRETGEGATPPGLDGGGPPEREADGGKLLRPYHRFTRENERSVEPGAVERYDVLLSPVTARIHPGHRLRLTVHTGATWAHPRGVEVDDFAGGVYDVLRSDAHPSHVNLPFVRGRLPERSDEWASCYTRCGESY